MIEMCKAMKFCNISILKFYTAGFVGYNFGHCDAMEQVEPLHQKIHRFKSIHQSPIF